MYALVVCAVISRSLKKLLSFDEQPDKIRIVIEKAINIFVTFLNISTSEKI